MPVGKKFSRWLQRDMKGVHRRSQLQKTRNPMSKTRENPSQASDDQLQFSGFTRNPEVSGVEGYCWITDREQRNTSSSSDRNESHDPYAQASGDPLQSKRRWKCDNMLSTGVKIVPNLAARVEEHLKTTFGTFSKYKFPSQHCNVVYCFRTRLHVGVVPKEHISRDLHQRLSELFHPDWKSSW